VGTRQEVLSQAFHNEVYDLAWNYDGSQLGVFGRDKKIRLYDPRKHEIANEFVSAHEGAKPQKLCYLGQLNELLTTGFSKRGERQYSIWDLRDTSKP
jgi:coronin-1B/1C/6